MDEIEKKARELLAAHLAMSGFEKRAVLREEMDILDDVEVTATEALRAIAAALSEARKFKVEPCCPNENRNFAGGCINCGDPSY